MNIVKSLALILSLLLFNVDSYAAKIELTTADDLTTILKRQDDHNKILIFFTSWCPYCKSTIHQIIDSHSTDKTTFISLDKNYAQIKDFASSMPENITIYYILNQNEIITFFNMHKIKYSGSIPYISILDSDNYLIADDISPRQLKKYLK